MTYTIDERFTFRVETCELTRFLILSRIHETVDNKKVYVKKVCGMLPWQFTKLLGNHLKPSTTYLVSIAFRNLADAACVSTAEYSGGITKRVKVSILLLLVVTSLINISVVQTNLTETLLHVIDLHQS